MERLLTCFITLLVLAACTGRGQYAVMRNGLDSLNHLNRIDQPFTMSDVEPYVDFFDAHGTANDRLLAHYLLGRAYYEHGETPMALQCYHDALDCADTTATDCDYAQLSRVYGQMGGIFFSQGLYRQLLVYEQLASKYAWMGNDTMAALISKEQESFAYNGLGYVDSSIAVVDYVSEKFLIYGYPSDAAISMGMNIRHLIAKGDYRKAKRYMDTYESMSGYFDNQGNIEPGREVYYNLKGLYYYYTNKLDSAEYWFRKELHDGRDFDNQNSAATGLALLYKNTHNSDSSTKYALYAYEMLDSIYVQRTTKEVERMQAMYDYTRHQEIAKREKEKVSIEEKKNLLSMAMLLLVISVAAFIIYKMHTEKQKRQKQYLQNLEQLEQTQSEVLKLRLHAEEYEELITIKERTLEEQSLKLQEQRKKSLQNHCAITQHIKDSEIYQILLKKQFVQKLTIQELRECRKLVLENLPEFNSLLISKQYKLNEKDFDVCVLLRLGFKSKEVSNMLDISQGRVSQICTKLLRDIFKKEKGGATELIEILHELW